MTLPDGLRMAWTTDSTGNVKPRSGLTRKIALPFTVSSGNEIAVISGQTDEGESMPENFTQLTTKVQATATHAVIHSWNDGSDLILKCCVSILIIERRVY